MLGMGFHWSYIDDRGEEVGHSTAFEDREEAEEWLGACWSDLLERGVEEVVLMDLDRERKLYRMGLRQEDPATDEPELRTGGE